MIRHPARIASQFRNCARLVDPASNPPLPGGAPFPPLTPH